MLATSILKWLFFSFSAEVVEEEAVIVATVMVFAYQGGCDDGFNNQLSLAYRTFFKEFVSFVSFQTPMSNI